MAARLLAFKKSDAKSDLESPHRALKTAVQSGDLCVTEHMLANGSLAQRAPVV